MNIKKLLVMLAALALLLALGACKKEPSKPDPSTDPSEVPSKDPSADSSKDPSSDASVDPSSSIAVTGISLNVQEISLFPGEGYSLTVTFTPSDATNKAIVWSSSDEAVAIVEEADGGENTVAAYGTVTAVAEGTATITAKSEDGGFTATCKVSVSDVLVESISLPFTSLTLDIGESFVVEPIFTPANATDKSFSLSVVKKTAGDVVVLDGHGFTAVGAGTATIRVTAWGGSDTITTEFDLTVVDPNAIPEGAVDLGLSVYWASSNLCESGLCAKPEDYGDYYAWGEISPKAKYSYDNYKWWTVIDYGNYAISKYCPESHTSDWGGEGDPDGLTKLLPEDDAAAAHVKLGGKWRMPTWDEWYELFDCDWERTTQNGVNGFKITSQKNGNSIFLPFSGCCFTDGIGGNSPSYVGEDPDYWSSELMFSSPSTAYRTYLPSSDSDITLDGISRYLGCTIRPVYAYSD